MLDFCDFVGSEWMSHVEAIACDMNADFERVFLKRHPHLSVVYDCFHIVKNFNEKVIYKVRKDRQARLKEEGDAEAARAPQALHIHPYVLCGHQEEEGARCTCRQGRLKGKRPFRQAGGCAEGRDQEGYEELISQNELPFACDIVDEMLTQAYSCTDADAIRAAMERIVDTCRCTKDRHLARVARPVEGHMEGIVAHARYHISSGRVEGTNCMIKTLRKAG